MNYSPKSGSPKAYLVEKMNQFDNDNTIFCNIHGIIRNYHIDISFDELMQASKYTWFAVEKHGGMQKLNYETVAQAYYTALFKPIRISDLPNENPKNPWKKLRSPHNINIHSAFFSLVLRKFKELGFEIKSKKKELIELEKAFPSILSLLSNSSLSNDPNDIQKLLVEFVKLEEYIKNK